MTFNKKVLAGLVAFAAASTSAQAVTVAANDGWELGVSGLINQFIVHTSANDNVGGASTGVSNDDFNEVRDGLLPAFLNFDMKAPTMNGLDIAAHISFSPATNVDSYSGIEQREVYFTVAGSFGTVLAGKALGLYGSHNILTEQTLFGIGYGTGGNGTTTLGGIGLGYDYASWRSQVKWTSNDMNGFKIALAVMDPAQATLRVAGGKPTGSLTSGTNFGAPTTAFDSEDLRYEGDLSYTGAFDGGSYLLWLSGMYQGDKIANGLDLKDNSQAWTVGGTLALGGFEFMAQYSDAQGSASATVENEWSQYIVQAGYRFGGTTLVSANYSRLTDDSSRAVREAAYGATAFAGGNANDDSVDRITVGVYHDVNANLKLVAEYTKVEDDNSDVLDRDIFGIGGFVFF
ncbi:MAG: porin [Methylophaga sp.]|nr:porin [Methylophaga sp.]